MPIITPKEYIEFGSNICPSCGSSDIEGGLVEVDSGGAWQDVSCPTCEATWTDTYALTGYSELTEE